MNKCKKIIGIILIILLSLLCLAPFANADTVEIILCEDKNLYDALCEINGAEGNDVLKTITISTDVLGRITELDLSGRKITNLKGIEEFTALTELNLSNNNITDISALKDLAALTNVNLSQNNISDLSALNGDFQTIIANNNKLTSLSSLKEVTSLVNLYVNDNLLTSLTGIETTNGLKEVYAANNRLNNISNVLYKTGLEVLDVSNNKITKVDAAPASTPVATEESEGTGEEGENPEPAEPIGVSLKQLNLSSNQLEDINFLSTFTGLTNLNLSKNKIRIIPEFFAIKMKNNSISALNMTEQKASIVTQDKEMLFDQYSGYTNLLYWAYYFKDQDLGTTVENGKLEDLAFSFTDEKKDATITIDDGVFAGSKIAISFGGSKLDKSTDDSSDSTATTDTATDKKETTEAGAEATAAAESTDDGTTASGKMPYTGITSKVVGIASLVTILGAIVVYTYSQNKKNIKK